MHRIQKWLDGVDHKDNYVFQNGKLYCRACNVKFICSKKWHIEQHNATAKHKQNIIKPLKQSLLTDARPAGSKKDSFYLDMCNAMVAANIPFFKLDCPQYKNFLEEYCQRKIPHRTTLSKNYLPECYQKVIEDIQNDIGNSDIWICVDETTDATGRYIANLIVGKLSDEAAAVSHLLACKVLERTNNATVARFVNESLAILWPSGIQHSKVRLFYSDAAPYMLKCVDSLRVFYPNIIHFTCLAHALNRVCEAIRMEYGDVNGLISNTKKVFLKAPMRVQYYKELLPNTNLPPEPILTRWGTWIKAVVFYNEHFEQIKQVVMEFDEDSAISVSNAQRYFRMANIRSQLAYIATHFKIIANSIELLETRGLPLTQSIQIVEDVKAALKSAPGAVAVKAYKKLESCLGKNPGYSIIHSVYKILKGEGEELPFEFKSSDLPNLKFIPVTSCDVERSFSLYKNILTDKRHNLNQSNIEKLLVCHSAAHNEF